MKMKMLMKKRKSAPAMATKSNKMMTSKRAFKSDPSLHPPSPIKKNKTPPLLLLLLLPESSSLSPPSNPPSARASSSSSGFSMPDGESRYSPPSPPPGYPFPFYYKPPIKPYSYSDSDDDDDDSDVDDTAASAFTPLPDLFVATLCYSSSSPDSLPQESSSPPQLHQQLFPTSCLPSFEAALPQRPFFIFI